MTIKEKEDELIETFDELEDWENRYTFLLDLGRELTSYPEKLKTPDRKIEGCQSNVWLDAEKTGDGKIIFSADADSLIVKGIVSMLIDVFSGHTPAEILADDLSFINRMGLGQQLSPTRSNGLLAMIKQMRAYALAFSQP